MNTSNEEVEMKGECVQMEFQGPFLNDGSSSHILFVISNCFYMCSYGNCSELEARGGGGGCFITFSLGGWCHRYMLSLSEQCATPR